MFVFIYSFVFLYLSTVDPVKLGNNKNDVIIILNCVCVCCPLSRSFKTTVLLKCQQCIGGRG